MTTEGALKPDMAGNELEEARNLQSMASLTALKAAKKELRTLMKQKLSNISAESVKYQSEFINLKRSIMLLNQGQAVTSSRVSSALNRTKKQRDLAYILLCLLARFKQTPLSAMHSKLGREFSFLTSTREKPHHLTHHAP
jgi:hypothetical protein